MLGAVYIWGIEDQLCSLELSERQSPYITTYVYLEQHIFRKKYIILFINIYPYIECVTYISYL